MKKILLVLLIFVSGYIYADGLETFANYPSTANSYEDGTFTGLDGSTWTYWQCRGDQPINDLTPCLGKGRTPIAEVSSGTIADGCLTLNFDYMQAFSTGVNLQVYVNSLLIGTFTTSGEQGVIKNSGDISVNIPGDFVVKFIQADNSGGQVSIDNVAWVSGGSVSPEPTNYPNNFNAIADNFNINLSWEDATGEQLPLAYVIIAKETADIVAPVDGTPTEDDYDLSDGFASVNVAYGVENYSFTNLDSEKTYYFQIFPYTNSGADINYKADGDIPTTNATISDITILNSENFDESWGGWTTFSVIGDQVWSRDNTYGIGGSACAKMSGYESGNFENEDWLISPALNFNSFDNVNLTFETAQNYSGEILEVMISVDYDGSSDPNIATWTNLDAELSSGGWTWASSGSIDLTSFSGENIYIAFKYISTASEATTWEVDDIQILAYNNVGINENLNNACNIYPNPANDIINIELNNNSYSIINIISIDGKIVMEKNIENANQKFDVSNLKSGIYFIRLTNANNNNIVKKLIINK